jgi:hypothetical protein
MADGSFASFAIPWDRFAEYFERGTLGSNYGAMCRTTAFGQFDLRRECRVCRGLGYKILSEERVTFYEKKIANESRDEEREHLRGKLANESFCGPCRGVGYISQRPKSQSKRMDSVYTTVLCTKCRGSDRRNERKAEDGSKMYPKLMHKHWGTSCGETFPPTDATAELQDKCPGCRGTMMVVPITARPALRTNDSENQGEDDEGPAGYFESAAASDPDVIARVVERISERDEEAELGLRLLSGVHGEIWAQHEWGRGFALWPLDESGQLLAEESRGESSETDRFARDLQLIEFERKAHLAGDVRDRRQMLLSQADTAARRRERRVVEAVLSAWGVA